MPVARVMAASSGSTLACLPYGTGGDREGVCLQVRLGPHLLLLDCGLNSLDALAVDTQPAAWAICSHAHAEHARGFLALHHRYPDLPIYTSELTGALLSLNWPSEQPEPFWQTLAWRSPTQLAPDLQVQLFPAGHLPGAAAILLTYQTPQRAYTLLYTGDFFLSNSRLVEGLSLEMLRSLAPDVLIVEGRYGTARHPRRRQLEKQLLAQIEEALMREYSLLLPVPPLGLGQELLVLLRSHHQFTGRDVEIWVAGQVAAACDRYAFFCPRVMWQTPTSSSRAWPVWSRSARRRGRVRRRSRVSRIW
ncbi:MAG: MBL fold metallo-hydrolase, partial [Spirulinaceae cyanobacterium RM2_2_10]|nr:MBL fold metallo-hydrolase [Spirulinaceae cyanobacterium RM2_2_10]